MSKRLMTRTQTCYLGFYKSFCIFFCIFLFFFGPEEKERKKKKKRKVVTYKKTKSCVKNSHPMSLPPPMVKYDAFGSDVPLAEPSWCALFSSFTTSSSSSSSLFFFLLVSNCRYNFRFDDVASRS